MDRQLLTSQLEAVLPALPEVVLVYLFGSQVEGETGPLSDVDLGVQIDREADELEVTARLGLALARALPGQRLDIVPLRGAPVELAYAVIRQGVCVYERDAATRVEYEAGVLGRYGDYLPVLRAFRREILEGGEHDRRAERYRTALGRTERTLGEIRAAKK